MTVYDDVIGLENVAIFINEQAASGRGLAVEVVAQVFVYLIRSLHDDIVYIRAVNLEPAYRVLVFGVKACVFVQHLGYLDLGVLVFEIFYIIIGLGIAKIADDIESQHAK